MFLPHGLGLYWRDHDTVQLGLRERVAVLPRLYPAEVPLLSLFRQPVTLVDVLDWAARHGIDSSRAQMIWDEVEGSGLGIEHEPDMLRVEFAALARAGDPPAEGERHLGLTFHGAGLIGSLAALAAQGEGFGPISLSDPSPVSINQARWLGQDTVGLPIDHVIRSRIRPRQDLPRDTVHISVTSRVLPRHLAGELLATDKTLLPVLVDEGGVNIGPVIAPGMGPCVECLTLHEKDRDPAWPHLEHQAGRLPLLEPDSTTALMAASWLVRELCQLATGSSRLHRHIIVMKPGAAWPTLVPVTTHPDCGCSASAIDHRQDR